MVPPPHRPVAAADTCGAGVLPGADAADAALLKRLRDPAPLFDRVDGFDAAGAASSLRQLQRLKCARLLRALCARARLPAPVRMGIDVAAGAAAPSAAMAAPSAAVTLSFPLPAGGGDRGGDTGDDGAAAECALLALSVHPRQRELEAAWAAAAAGGAGGPALAANACLLRLYEETDVAVVRRRVNLDRGTCTVHLQPYAECRVPRAESWSARAPRFRALQYGPRYCDLDGRGAGGGAPAFLPAAAAEARRGAVLDEMVARVWQHTDAARYVADPGLREEASRQLRRLFACGLRGAEGHFAPVGEPLGLYLHGPAGCGKSEFVAVLRGAVEATVREFVDPAQHTALVKVPLNATAPATLSSQAFVRGVNDHSIERMLEQSVCQGHLAVLHLEENPEDHDLQRALHRVLWGATGQRRHDQGCVAKLLARYPDKDGAVLFIGTSNYALADGVGLYSAAVRVPPPPPASRRAWAAGCFAAAVHRAAPGLGGVTASIDAVPDTPDMRQLHRWWTSAAFAAAAEAARRVPPGGAARIDVAAVGSGEWDVGFGDGAAPLRIRAVAGSLLCVADGAGAGDALGVVTAMLAAGFVSPGVVVLRGAGAAAAAARTVDAVAARLGAGAVVPLRCRLESDDDKHRVFGAPSEIRGGLLAEIDDVTNPNAPRGGRVAAVAAEVTEWGQFALRELLEQGAVTRTHRLAVRKRGLFVALALLPGTRLTPQVESRAHAVIDTDDDACVDPALPR